MYRSTNYRRDGIAKVTGKAQYAADISFPNMVHAAVVRSPIAHGNIVSIHSEKALALPGIIAVYTAKDIPGIPAMPKERPILCPNRVRYIGDGVALVVAETMALAKEGAKLIEVSYEELPALLDPTLALLDNAVPIHENGNQICRYITKRGNAQQAIEEAPHRLSRTYSTHRVQHTSLETEAVVASYDGCNGEMHLHCPINSPFVIRKIVADTLACPLCDVRVVPSVIGGSFGGKNYDIAVAASRAALVSRLLSRPCKIVLSREESIQEGTKRHPLQAHYNVGFDEDGRLLGMEINLLLDGGAYTSKTFPVTSRMAIEATGPYVVPHVDTVSTAVYTNHVYSDALRGFGSPQVDFCSESLLDEIAAFLGKDPLEVRRLNMLRENSVSAFGQTMKNVTLDACLQALQQQLNIEEKRREFAAFNAVNPQLKKGLGICFLHRGESFGAAGQGLDVAQGAVSIQQDGSIFIHSSIAEVGQGAHAMMIQLLHEYFSIPCDKIRLSRVDTSSSPDAGPTVATRGTVFSGGAVLDAAKQLAKKMAAYAKTHVGTEDILFINECLVSRHEPERKVSFNSLVKEIFAAGDHLNAYGFFSAPPLQYDKSCGVGEAYWSFVYGVAAAEVSVDLRTGAVSVDHYYGVHDVGHAFDLQEVNGQIMGGISMGLGYALLEEVEMETGKIQNLNLESYLLPTAMDMPQMHPIVLEHPGPVGPLGAKGLGEPSTCVVAPAIVNAIHDACGKRICHLPANLEHVALGKFLKKNSN